MAEEVRAAADQVKKHEAKTQALAKELTSTDVSVVEAKIGEVQAQIDAGNLGFKEEKELIKMIKVLAVDKERLKEYWDDMEVLVDKKKVRLGWVYAVGRAKL